MKLTTKEKYNLFGEGIVTLVLLLLLDLAVFVIVTRIIESNPGLQDGIFIIKQSVMIGPEHFKLMSWENLFIVAMGVIDIIVIWWRLIRRYHQIQLRHIISELHYIADGHFDHRIPFQLKGDDGRVVNSVNALVDSVIESIDDERSMEKSKDKLVTSVSHDLRTPLTSILGYLGLIENSQYDTPEQGRKYAHIAYEKAEQMKALVDRLFEYTKAGEKSRENQRVDWIDINQLLDQLASSFKPQADKEKITIDVDPMKKDRKIRANAESIGRVFNNLISNALKYGSDGNNIYLKARQDGPSAIVIDVANDGKIIPAHSIKHIFDRFYRVEESRNVKTGGSGLGLAIVNEVVNNQGGYVEVDSTNRMTSFAVHLPVDVMQPIKKGKKQEKDEK